LTLPAGQSRLLRFPAISKAAIGNPSVADIALLSATEVLLNAKGPGETLLYVRNSKGAASVTVKVDSATATAANPTDNINQALSDTGVTATLSGATVVLRGSVETPEAETKAVAVAKAFTPNVASMITVSRDATADMARVLSKALEPMSVTARSSGSTVIVLEGSTTTENAALVAKTVAQIATGFQIVNLVKDNVAGRQVVVHARIIAADQTALRDSGFDWGRVLYDSNNRATGVTQPIIFGQYPADPSSPQTAGPLRQLNNIGAAMQALEQGNRAKTLSAPDVLVQDNHNASIQVGGEIPVPVPQIGAGGVGSIIVEFKSYGVQLNVTPRILEDGMVSMHVAPEVSTLDQANAVLLSGFRIPAFKVRKAESDVTVRSGDTLVIGGLLQDEDIDLIRKIPGLADIPLLGELFKFREKSRVRTQLVILVTPEILPVGGKPPIPEMAGIKPDSVKLPPDWAPFKAEPNEAPVMPGLPAPGKSPIPMSSQSLHKLTSNPGLTL
jgi:pilus assembly protein CpaC